MCVVCEHQLKYVESSSTFQSDCCKNGPVDDMLCAVLYCGKLVEVIR